MNVPTDESHVFLAVSDFGDDPSLVTSLLDLSPTQAWHVGDPLPNHPTALRNHSRWTFRSPLPLSAHVDEHMEALLSLLELLAPRIRDCAARFPTELRCAIYYRQSFTPGIHLSETTLQRVAALGVPLDFELYFVGANGDSDIIGAA